MSLRSPRNVIVVNKKGAMSGAFGRVSTCLYRAGSGGIVRGSLLCYQEYPQKGPGQNTES